MPRYITFKNYSIKEFFTEIKNKTGLSNNKLAKFLNVHRSMIYNYLKNECKFKYDYFLKLCQLANIPQNKYDFIITNINDNKIEDMILPKPNQNLAEFIGIMLGDGSLYQPKGIKKKYYFLRIGNHTIYEKEYREYIKKLFFGLFKIELKTYEHKSRKEVLLCCNSRKVFEFIEKYGFSKGNKKKNNIGIPKWIISNTEYLKTCIRGIVDTDGTVFPKSRNKKLPQIEISSNIPNLREDIRNGLIKLEFKPSNWSKGGHCSNCGLYAKEQVLKFYNEIGFSNSKHTKKFIKIIS